MANPQQFDHVFKSSLVHFGELNWPKGAKQIREFQAKRSVSNMKPWLNGLIYLYKVKNTISLNRILQGQKIIIFLKHLFKQAVTMSLSTMEWL